MRGCGQQKYTVKKMAKLNISSLLESRKKIRILSVLAAIVLIFIAAELLVLKNPKGTKAAAHCTSGGNPNPCIITDVTYNIDSVANDYSNEDVVLGDGSATVTITMNTPHTFKSLTIKSNATLTHDALTSADYDDHDTLKADSDPNNSAAPNAKQINITVTGTLTVEGSINVNGKGAPGGDPADSDYSGYGYMVSQDETSSPKVYTHSGGLDVSTGTTNRGGGGGNGGIGGKALIDATRTDTKIGADTNIYEQANGDVNIPQYGSGGGGAKIGAQTGRGGAGGGIIVINAGIIDLTLTGAISANGNAPDNGVGGNNAVGGAGAGGYINIKAVELFKFPNDGLPSANGGAESYAPQSDSKGQNGVVQLNPPNKNFGSKITASGGNGKSPNSTLTASGSGGMIAIDSPLLGCPEINPTNGNTIPAGCEGPNITVTIDGKGTPFTVFADGVLINKNTGALCTVADQGTPNSPCDSKRHFASLTIRNNAILTHNPITIPDMASAVGGSLVNATTGTGRWKKVDIILSGGLTIEGGGSINVDGKGYPGGYSGHTKGYGPGGGSFTSGNAGGGGGYGGHGGQGGHDSGNSFGKGGIIYDSMANPSEWGSGGGGGSSLGRSGGAGGGFVRVVAASVYFSTSNAMVARGAYGKYDKAGAGSGGTINLTAALFSVNMAPAVIIDASGNNGGYIPVENGGHGGGGRVAIAATNFQGVDPNDLMTTTNYISNTSGIVGSPRYNNSGPAINLASYDNSTQSVLINFGERGTVYIPIVSSGGSNIKKKLIPISRAGSASFNPYALQVDDVIKVEITVPLTSVGMNVTDEFLKTPSGNKCAYFGSDSPAAFSTTDPIVWRVDASGTDVKFSYQCKVE